MKINDTRKPELNSHLNQNFPNPFNPHTRIEYQLLDAMKVELSVYDLSGRLVQKVVDDDKLAGNHVAFWEGTDYQSRHVASGIYFYQLKTKQEVLTRKMILLD